MNIKRQPSKVLTEENLAAILSDETEKLNLENHYWLSCKFLSKISTMSPNLTTLSLRRMSNIDNLAFADIFKHLSQLCFVDLSETLGCHSSSLQLMISKNRDLEQLQLSGCVNAVDDDSIRMISDLEYLTMLDVSYCNKLTDEGCKAFDGKTTTLTTLYMNCCSKVGSQGIISILNSCKQTLFEIELACND